MQVMYQRCAGIDVHLRFLVVCLIVIEAGQRRKEIRTFRNETVDLLALRTWLVQEGCTHVGMESTGVYWMPVYRRLEGFFELIVANAQHIKGVPGRKTDVQDAEWIADLLQHGLIRASFVPSQEQQDLRDLTRTRVSLVQERSRLVNRVQKVLEEAGIKLSTVLSDVMGLSGRAILDAICEGESDPARLARRVHPTVHATQEQVTAALTAEVREHHRFLLRELLTLIDAQDRSIKHLEQEIEQRLRPFEEQINRCEQINGVGRQILSVLMAEIGTELSRFPDAEHLSSWAGVCPGQKESAGKRLSGRSRQGNRYVRAALVQAAHAVRRSRTHLGERYRRLKKRRGSKRAALAVGHSILVIYYQMMKTGQEYQERGETFLRQMDHAKAEQHLVRRLERLGYQVISPPQPAA
ncbi:MAG: IS110 family transposase [Ktedonobacteraceae bacterium]